MNHERKITKIYRDAPGGWKYRPTIVVTGDRQIIDLSKRLPRTRSSPSPAPKVVRIQLGTGNRDYNKGGRGPIIDGEYRRLGDGPTKWTNGERLAWRLSQLARLGRKFGRLHPYGRLIDAGLNAWDIWNLIMRDRHIPDPEGWIIPPGGNWICGGPGDSNGVAIQGAKSPKTSPTYCALTLQAVPVDQASPWPGYSLIFYKSYAVGQGQRCDMRGLYNRLDGARPPKPVRGGGTAPYVPIITKPLPYTKTDTQTGSPPPIKPPPLPPVEPKSRPPRPREKERKGQVAAGVGAAVKAAFAASEGKDAVEALWDALPDHIKRSTPKTGRTRKGALIGEGQPYSTVLDKALHLFKNLKHLNLSVAARNLLINQIVDKFIGTLSAKGADKLRKQLGASGWGKLI